MTRHNRILPTILWVTLGCILLRMFCSWFLADKLVLFEQPEVHAFLLHEQEQEPVQLQAPEIDQPEVTAPKITQPPETTAPVTQPPVIWEMPEVPDEKQHFESEDTDYIEINYSANRSPDVADLLTQPLNWNLTSDKPSVLIFHTHGTEAFTPTAGTEYEEVGGEYRTTDDQYNMIHIGEELARLLNEAGIRTVHDCTYYDYPDYTISYDNARIGLQEQLRQYPTVKLVIDLHRDSAERTDGSQWSTNAVINGEQSAQVMLVMATDSYYTHPNWEKNLSIALKLQTLMEKAHSGSTRPLDLRRQRFNQDLSTGAIIAEIGAAGNTQREAMNAVSVLAEAIIMLARGSN